MVYPSIYTVYIYDFMIVCIYTTIYMFIESIYPNTTQPE